MDEKQGMTTAEAIARQRSAHNTAVAFGIAFLAIACGIAYWIWPTGVVDQTLAATTIGQMLRMLGAIVVASAGLILAAMMWS